MKRYILLFFFPIIAASVFLVIFKVYAADSIKTSEIFINSFPAQVSSATSSQFTLYIGDNLNGVSAPLKSIYFAVTGVYTGNGSVEFKIDDDAATAKTYTLPSVAAATAFEILYKDDSGKINPTSAGSYNYTLNINPSGVTISGLAARGTETHRYKPPSCGAGFKISGDLISRAFEATATSAGPAYNSILWKGALGGPSQNQGKVRLQLATSDCPNGETNYPACSAGSWSFIGGSTCAGADWYEAAADTPVEVGCFSQINNKRYFKYKIRLCSDDCSTAGQYTPQVDDVVVNWSP